MSGAEFAANFTASLAATLADKALAAGAGALNRWARGRDEERALRRCLESAFTHMLANLGATDETQRQVGEAFGHALRNTAAAEALLQTALAPDPSPDAFRKCLIEAGLDPDTLYADVDAAFSLLVEGFENETRPNPLDGVTKWRHNGANERNPAQSSQQAQALQPPASA